MSTLGATITFGAPQRPKPAPPVRNVFLSFQGIGFSTGATRSFDVISGQAPPTITGGYAKWTVLSRPLQRGLTFLDGYDPTTMTVSVIFGQWGTQGWQIGDRAAQKVETDIGSLEWMAGSNFVSGPSPVVYVFSHSSQGGDSDLIPPQYRGVPWIVTGLEWGTAYRNPSGSRVWQEATVTLQNYLNLGAPPAADTSASGGYFISKPGRDTPLLIAGAPSVNSPTVDHSVLAGRICEDAKNNPCKATSIRLQRKSVYFAIRHGVNVFIPSHQSL